MKKLLRPPKIEELIQTESPITNSPQKNGTPPVTDIKPGYLLHYCGSITIGNAGDVKQIEGAMRKLLNSGNTEQIPVRFECLELGIRITRDSNYEVIKNFYQFIFLNI